ncbi:unnamed protein product, partial [Cyprideis torosa]
MLAENYCRGSSFERPSCAVFDSTGQIDLEPCNIPFCQKQQLFRYSQPCATNEQCQNFLPNTICQNLRCVCRNGYEWDGDDKQCLGRILQVNGKRHDNKEDTASPERSKSQPSVEHDTERRSQEAPQKLRPKEEDRSQTSSLIFKGLGMDFTKCRYSIRGAEYIGKINTTASGKTCQRWDMSFPHVPVEAASHDEDFPDGSRTLAENYCRNPNLDSSPWCYTTDPEVEWEYCDVPSCRKVNDADSTRETGEDSEPNQYQIGYQNEDDLIFLNLGFLAPFGCRNTARGKEYIGSMSRTVSGKRCQRWDASGPHEPSGNARRDENFPDGSRSLAKNYCRNPDSSSGGPWCYTSDPDIRREYCNIPYCRRGSFFTFGQDCTTSRECHTAFTTGIFNKKWVNFRSTSQEEFRKYLQSTPREEFGKCFQSTPKEEFGKCFQSTPKEEFRKCFQSTPKEEYARYSS